MKTNPLEKMKKRSPRTQFFWCYTLGFLLCAAGCYCWFLIKGKTLIVVIGKAFCGGYLSGIYFFYHIS